MEKLNQIIQISYSILAILFSKKAFVSESNLKVELNKELNKYKNYNKSTKVNIINDSLDYIFNDCIRLLLKYNLINYRLTKGQVSFNLNNIGRFVCEKSKENYDAN